MQKNTQLILFLVPIFYFRNIKFEPPEHISIEDYKKWKTFGVYKNENKFVFSEFNRTSLVLISISVICFFFFEFGDVYYREVFKILVFLSGWYGISRIIIENIQLNQFKRREIKFYEKLNMLLRTSLSYEQFLALYKEEIKTSDFGKFLIKNFRQK